MSLYAGGTYQGGELPHVSKDRRPLRITRGRLGAAAAGAVMIAAGALAFACRGNDDPFSSDHLKKDPYVVESVSGAPEGAVADFYGPLPDGAARALAKYLRAQERGPAPWEVQMPCVPGRPPLIQQYAAECQLAELDATQ